MALTREFKETIVARARRDAKFRDAMFAEAINAYLAGIRKPARRCCATGERDHRL